jgi:prevent-host-death family protein
VILIKTKLIHNSVIIMYVLSGGIMPINLKTIRPITELRSHANTLFKLSEKNDGPVIITQNGIAVGVVIAADVYEDMVLKSEEDELLKLIDEAEDDIKRGHVYSFDEVKKEIKAILGRKKK